MTTSKDWYIFFASAALLVCSLGLAVGKFSFTISRWQIEPGQTTRLEIELPLSAVSDTPWDLEQFPPQVNDELLTNSKAIVVLETNYEQSGEVLKWQYHLTGHHLGTFAIPPVEIRLGPHTFSTENIPVSIETTREKEDFHLREEYGELSVPFVWKKWFNLIFLIPLCLIGFWLWKRYGHFLRIKRPHPSFQRIVVLPAENPKQWLKRQIARIRKRQHDKTLPPVLIDELSDVVREYYARTTHMPVQSWTTTEMSQRLDEQSKANEVARFLRKCDEFKYAPNTEDNYLLTLDTSVSECERILL